jgi:hypothetical protein
MSRKLITVFMQYHHEFLGFILIMTRYASIPWTRGNSGRVIQYLLPGMFKSSTFTAI